VYRTKSWEILEKLSDWWLLKKGSAPWSQLFGETYGLHRMSEKFAPTDKTMPFIDER
jgi:hypothetical protein